MTVYQASKYVNVFPNRHAERGDGLILLQCPALIQLGYPVQNVMGAISRIVKTCNLVECCL